MELLLRRGLSSSAAGWLQSTRVSTGRRRVEGGEWRAEAKEREKIGRLGSWTGAARVVCECGRDERGRKILRGRGSHAARNGARGPRGGRAQAGGRARSRFPPTCRRCVASCAILGRLLATLPAHRRHFWPPTGSGGWTVAARTHRPARRPPDRADRDRDRSCGAAQIGRSRARSIGPPPCCSCADTTRATTTSRAERRQLQLLLLAQRARRQLPGRPRPVRGARDLWLTHGRPDCSFGAGASPIQSICSRPPSWRRPVSSPPICSPLAESGQSAAQLWLQGGPRSPPSGQDSLWLAFSAHSKAREA